MPSDESQPKHLQLGVDPDAVEDEDRAMLTDPAAIEAVWAEATTVEQYKADLETLGEVDPEIVEELRRARHGG